MGLIGKFNNKVLGGRPIHLALSDQATTAAPSAGSHVGALVGTIVHDTTNDNWYICSVTAGNTWILLNA